MADSLTSNEILGENESEPGSNFINNVTISHLSTGILGFCQPQLEGVKHQLDELTKKQNCLLNLLETENKVVAQTQASEELQELFLKMKTYLSKLVTVKREMTQIHERTGKLKKRALKLQQIKQKEALQREHKRETELQREQELIAKPSTSKKS